MRKTTVLAAAIVLIVVVIIGVYVFMRYGSGTLQVQMADPPTDWGLATQVYIDYSAIEAHRTDAGNESGWSTLVGGGTINLTQTLDAKKTIGSSGLQAGSYNLIRFKILGVIVTVGGVNFTASVQPGRLQVAVTEGGVQVNAAQTSTLLIELNIKVESNDGVFSVVPDVRATPI